MAGGILKRVAPGLRRYSTSGVYFAHVRIHGKLFRESLETTDRATATRKLSDYRRSKLKLDHGAGRTMLADLCEKDEATPFAEHGCGEAGYHCQIKIRMAGRF